LPAAAASDPLPFLSNSSLFDSFLDVPPFTTIYRKTEFNFMRIRLFLFLAIVLAISSATAISFAQRKPPAEKPIAGDFKITVRTSVSGQTLQGTTMIKGQRERTETVIASGNFSMTTVNITQCDMRRTIQVNDRLRKYLVTPMESDDSATDSRNTQGAPAGIADTRRGGVVTMTVNTIDTGERKEMFGFTARHLKRTTVMESSPDACQQQKMKIETDGWYINLEYGLSCPTGRTSQGSSTTTSTGCRDRYQYKTTGPTHIGYPLVETTTMYGADGSVTTTLTKEVIEISRATLDTALFDVPAGYSEAKSQQEMYAQPSAADMSGAQPNQASSSASSSDVPVTANAARIRVGVVELNNKTKASVSTDSLRDQLIASLNNSGIEAIPLNAISPADAVVEAKAKQCAYILFTDIATLKAPSTGKKLGGLLGRAAGVGSGEAGKAEARLDFRLLPTGSSSPAVQSSASAKEETQEASLNTAIQSEVRAVVEGIPRT
jgi:hypothetical protein